MNMKMKDKAKTGTSRRGRPNKFEPQLSANASTGSAIAAMARQGAAWNNALAGLRHAPKRAQKIGQGTWSGAAELAQFLGLGGKDVFNRMALGRTPIALEKAVGCMRELIKKGLLDPQELRAIPRTVGHARALHPFAPALGEIRKARYFQVPSEELSERVDQLAENYRSALSTRADAESEERTALRAARAAAVCALLDLQKVLGRESLNSDREIIEAVVTAIEQVNETMSHVALSVCEVALSPREASILAARQFMAPNSPDGQPDFAGLFRAVTMGAPEDAETRAASIDKLVKRVTDRWGIDPRLGGWRDAEPNWRVLDFVVSTPRTPRLKHPIAFARRPRKPLSLRTRRARVKVTFKYARNAGAPVREFASRYSELTARDLKFMRRITRPGGPHDPRLLLTMAMAEEWYFGDERPDCRQTDFENRLDQVREWAVSVLPRATISDSHGREAGSNGDGKVAQPTKINLKRLIKELMQLDVRPIVELNMDMPEPAPL